jgi:hypothetical protein
MTFLFNGFRPGGGACISSTTKKVCFLKDAFEDGHSGPCICVEIEESQYTLKIHTSFSKKSLLMRLTERFLATVEGKIFDL